VPIVIRVEGYVGEKPAHLKSLDRWVVATNDTQRVFHVTALRPIGRDIAYWTILSALEPMPVTLMLYGDPGLLRQVTDAPPGEPIAMVGSFQLGPGPATLMLQSVELLPTPTAASTLTAPTAGSTPGS
jgi:hypothetical protein